MRAPTLCRAAAILGALALCTTAADAGKKKKKKKKAETVDVSGWKDKWQVYTDGDGSYLMAVPGDSDSIFYGDGKTMYKQRSPGSGRNPPRWDFRMWSPRVNGVADFVGSDDVKDKVGSLTCGNDEFELTRVSDDDAKKIIDKAQFLDVYWKRQAEKLSRDDRGNYYFIDRLRDEYGGKGYRLFAGQKGAMKELPLINIVSDSKGQIYASKRGELRFIFEENAESDTATWIKGEKKTALTLVPVEDNIPLIYGELGVYEGTLGTPCDEY